MKLLAGAACTALLAGTLVACAGGGDDDGRTEVVASFYPAQFLAERIGGDDVSVTTLTSPGAEAHDLELTAKQVMKVNEADVVVYLSNFQEAVDHAVEDADRDGGSTVDMAEGVAPIEGEDEHDHEHDEGHDHEGHDHDHGGVDPHVWLNPANMVTAAAGVRDALVEADPDGASTYEANADELIAELEDLDADFTSGLASCKQTEFVTSHAAFGHLAAAYGLTQIAISGIDPQSEPTTAALAEITEEVEDHGITTIFTERLASSALAETVARETGAETAVLDPIEGLSDETTDEDYVSLMRQNLDALTKANDCS
ncbi:metal ABC transporter substrate-binding protein [Aeromicrobium choanae]|uniref:Zinc transport system substrate-binding protein n=1 Tax=Aeromicrobium choanae TaxID=1736691 RepID=A0A1T4Z8E1_9ACTN|nr:zinc ABC transporter substrate-binding protein [Aeromicrobium choanae]SKB10123.1 zinc transport system substrate-binding protein [Aeromicrobium choanae]